MKILTDSLYNVVDELYLKRDDLERTITDLKRKQSETFSDIEKYDDYMTYRDMEQELESIIENIEELEYRIGDLELMDLDFEKYSNMDIEQLREEAKSYSLSTKGDRLNIVQRIMNKVHN